VTGLDKPRSDEARIAAVLAVFDDAVEPARIEVCASRGTRADVLDPCCPLRLPIHTSRASALVEEARGISTARESACLRCSVMGSARRHE
jgi:hypothetical protein